MKQIENWRGEGAVPTPIRYAANALMQADPADPEVFECEVREIEAMDGDDLIYQLLIDRKTEQWYFVGAGTYNRTKTNLHLLEETRRKMEIRRATLYFARVDDAWIRQKRRSYESQMAAPPMQVG